MDEIPGFVWLIIGAFVSLVSLFMGFLRPVTYSAFFQLMFVVGIGMLVYGYIFKIKMNERTTRQILEDRRQHNLNLRKNEMEVDIDIDDFRNDPRKREEVLRRGYPSTANQVRMPQGYNAQQGGYGAYGNGSQAGRGNMQPQQSQYQAQQRDNMQQPMRQAGQQGRFCTSCGTPLLKEHKYCPICGART